MELEKKIISQCTDQGWRLSTAESCTGGLLSHILTNVPGSSAVFYGGFIVYDNQAKVNFLKIDPLFLEEHGAVSQEVVEVMAKQSQQISESDIAVAITGIAGPSGATPEKPVGLVYIAIALLDKIHVFKEHFSGGRQDIKQQTAAKALTLLWDLIAE